jgi:hypothetical protein
MVRNMISTQGRPPEMSYPVRAFIRGLKNRGYDVEVLSGGSVGKIHCRLTFKPDEASALVRNIKIPAGLFQEERERRGRNGKEVDLISSCFSMASIRRPAGLTLRLYHPGLGVLFS